MNKDAKIGLFAVLILVVLVAVMWAKLAGSRDEVAPADPSATDVALNDADTSGQGSEMAIIRNPANPVTHPADGYRPGDAPFENAGRGSLPPPPPAGIGEASNPLGHGAMTPGTPNTNNLVQPGPAAGTDRAAGITELFPGMDKAAGVDPLAGDLSSGTPTAIKEHTVVKNESLAVIARKYGVTWQAIAEANKAALPDPAKLKIGQKLQIPEPAAKAEPAPKTEPVQETVKPEQPKTEPSTPAAGKTYTVKRNDTLISISRAAYGKAGLWKAILNANKDKVPSPDKLRPGMVLILPEKP